MPEKIKKRTFSFFVFLSVVGVWYCNMLLCCHIIFFVFIFEKFLPAAEVASQSLCSIIQHKLLNSINGRLPYPGSSTASMSRQHIYLSNIFTQFGILSWGSELQNAVFAEIKVESSVLINNNCHFSTLESVMGIVFAVPPKLLIA